MTGFSDEQKKQLQAKLDPANVSQRKAKGSGPALAYVEGWHVVAEANRIFGFDGWSRETVELRLVFEGANVNGTPIAAYTCRVRITVYAGSRVVVRDGCGWGQGFGGGGEAHEKAVKEAETDAMKRALSTFGWPFGLALYDKDREHVGAPEPEPKEERKPPPQRTEARGRAISDTPEDRREPPAEGRRGPNADADAVATAKREGERERKRATDHAPPPGAAREAALARKPDADKPAFKGALVPVPKDDSEDAWDAWTERLRDRIYEQPGRPAAEAFCRAHAQALRAASAVLRSDLLKWVATVVTQAHGPKDEFTAAR